MNHQVPDELISAYFDGEVTPSERAQVEQLLESSTELRQLLDDTSKLSALLHSFPREAAPSELAANVQRQIEAKTPPAIPVLPAKRHSLRREGFAFASGIIATAASLMIYVTTHQGHPMGITEALPDGTTQSEMSKSSEADSTPALKSSKFAPNAKDAEQMVAVSGVTQLQEGVDEMNSALGQMMPADQADFGMGTIDNNAFEPPTPEKYWDSLQSGDVVVVLDPTNHVAVMQLAVVDREKTAEGLKLLFHKHAVNPVDRELSGPQLVSNPESKLTKESGAASDDLFVMYVRASKTQLGEAISELKKNPQLYVKMEPQLPVEIANGFVNAGTIANNEPVVNSPTSIDRTISTGDIDQPTVAEEANLAVNSFARQRGQFVLEDNAKSSENSVAGLESGEATSKEKSQADAIASKKLMSRRSAKDGQAFDAPSTAVTAANADKPGADKSGANVADTSRNDSSQGYKTFHVILGSQRQQMEQQVIGQQSMMARNSAMPPAPATAPAAARSVPAYQSMQNGGGQNPQGLGNGLTSNTPGANTPGANTLGGSAVFRNSVGSNPPGGNSYGSAPNYSRSGRGNSASRVATASDNERRASSDNDRLVKLLIILKQESQAEAAKAEGADGRDNSDAPPP